MGPCARRMLWQPGAWRRRAIPGDSEEGFEAWAPRLGESLAGTTACRRSVLGKLQRGSLPTAGVTREGNGCLSAAFARTLPKPSCCVYKSEETTRISKPVIKAGWDAGHVLQKAAVLSAKVSFTPRLRNSPKWRSSRQQRGSTGACFWKYLALQRYF